jgi:hypothetical protein
MGRAGLQVPPIKGWGEYGICLGGSRSRLPRGFRRDRLSIGPFFKIKTGWLITLPYK